MIRTPVVGGLKAIAEEWLRAEAECEELDRKISDLKREREAAYDRQCNAGNRLIERVGANVTTRAFSIDGRIVLVEHERGIRSVRAEME